MYKKKKNNPPLSNITNKDHDVTDEKFIERKKVRSRQVT